MSATATALWLDTFFSGYDHFFLMILHAIATKLGVILTPLMRLITLLGEKGVIFFLLALIFFLGSPAEDGYSFPSGHVTACAAGMTAISLMRGKKWVWPSVIIVVVMGISRNYLMAHYPSDVLFAAIIGVFSGFVAWFITQLIFRFLRQRRNDRIWGTVLAFDIRDVLPFELPQMPVKKGGVKAAFAALRHGSPRAAAVEEPDADEDVKTYTGSHAIVRESEAEPARKSATAGSGSSGGRHAIVRESENEGAAKRARLTLPGAYKGKHEK